MLLALRAGRTQLAGVGPRKREAIVAPLLIKMGVMPLMLSIVELLVLLFELPVLSLLSLPERMALIA